MLDAHRYEPVSAGTHLGSAFDLYSELFARMLRESSSAPSALLSSDRMSQAGKNVENASGESNGNEPNCASMV